MQFIPVPMRANEESVPSAAAELRVESAATPASQSSSPGQAATPQDPEMLKSLKGMSKEEAALNLFINRSLTVESYRSAVADMERYFSDHLDYTGQFMASKFGFACKSWLEFTSALDDQMEGWTDIGDGLG